jgi:DNA gyrase subunit A
MEYIKGPDYPLAGRIINKKDIKTAFATGRSAVSLKIQGDYEIEGNKIIFTTIPYRTYRNKIKEQIDRNIEEFDKILEDFNDESNVGKNRLVFTLKSGISHKLALNKIFAFTDLQTSISYNMNFIVNGTPKLCSLKDLIVAYVDHQIDVLLKATEYDKNKAEKRAHILRGLIIATDKINEVIELIKTSSDKTEAQNKLIDFLDIDEIQANAILDMKLAKLTRIDKDELKKELQEKENIVAECIKIITDSEHRNDVLISKIETMRDKYGDERRTQLLDLEEPKNEEKEIINVEPEKCVVVMTESGLIKRIPSTSFKTQRRNGKGVKTVDDIIDCVIRTNTIDNLMIFTNKGRMYRILVDNIPVGTNTSKGQPIKSLIEMESDEEATVMYSIYRDTSAKYVLFVTKSGLVKKTALEEYLKTKKKSGIAAINLKENDSLASVTLVDNEDLIVLTKNGMGIRFSSNDVAPSGRTTMGIKAITLKSGDEVLTALPIRDINDTLAIFGRSGFGKKFSLTELARQNRGGKGLIVYKEEIAAAALVSDEDRILVIGTNNSICISAKEIPLMSRTAIGNQIIRNTRIEGVSKV